VKQNWKSWLPLGGMLFALYLAIHYWTPFCRLAGLGLQAAAPLLLGAVMAYAVNILMSMLESRLFPRGGSLSRPVSLVLAYASLAAQTLGFVNADNVGGVIRLKFAPLWFMTGLLFEYLTKPKGGD